MLNRIFYSPTSGRTVAIALAVAVSASLVGTLGCSASRTKKGAGIGAAAGAAIGAIVSDDKTKGAVIGGAAGAVVGGVIGHYMDKQAADLAKIEGAKTERIGDEIRVTFDSAILFDFDSAMLKVGSQTQIKQMAEVINKYPDTDLVISGHTDSEGGEKYNQKLSERRAMSVRTFFIDMGVMASRLETVGYGELRPVASNDRQTGRDQNRRVEIEIRANDDLRSRAAESEGKG
ncbi:MAG: OmpA family protein [Candidatus Krumholzibacteria bacterium]